MVGHRGGPQMGATPSVVPPQTYSIWPVTKPLSGDRKNRAARATSSGVPRRLTTMLLMMRSVCGARRHVDDAAEAGRAHRRQRGLHQDQRGAQMQVDHVVQVGQRGRVGGAGTRGAGVVDQADDVVGRGHFGGHCLGARLVGQVGLVRHQPRRRMLGQAVVDVDDFVPGIQQHADDGGADPGAAAGHQIRGRFAHLSSQFSSQSRRPQEHRLSTFHLPPHRGHRQIRLCRSAGVTPLRGRARARTGWISFSGLQVSPPGGRAQARTGGLNASDSPMPGRR